MTLSLLSAYVSELHAWQVQCSSLLTGANPRCGTLRQNLGSILNVLGDRHERNTVLNSSLDHINAVQTKSDMVEHHQTVHYFARRQLTVQ